MFPVSFDQWWHCERHLANSIIVLPQNATLLLCSTVPASYAQSVAAELQSCGRGDIQFIDAPVSGGAKRAADGTLSIMAGASDAALESGRFLLEAMSDSDKLYLVPGGIGAGSNMKMVHQVLAGIHILGASEAMGFAAQLGLDAHKIADAIKSGDAWSWMHENRLQRMLEEDWHPGASALTIILKDVVSIIVSLSWNTIANEMNRESSLLLPARTSSLLLCAQQLSKSTCLLSFKVMVPSMTPPWSASITPRPLRRSRAPCPPRRLPKHNN